MKRLILLWGTLLPLLLAACGPTPTPTAVPTTARGGAATTPAAASPAPARSPGAVPGGSPASSPRVSGPPTKLTLGLGYIPDVQFAPFYVAKEKGYFRDEGLDVDFRQGFETDVLKLVGTDALQFGVASGDEVLVARSQGVPLVYVATWFQKFPITVMAPEGANIRRTEDLKGRTVGVPGRFGATYVGLRALLASAGMSEGDVRLREVGFTQVQALTQGQAEAVVGYTNNEPIQLRNLGQAITTINVFDYVQLVSNGLVTNEKTASERPDLVERMVRATLRGVQDVIARPDEAVEITVTKYVPEAAGRREVLRQVLDASIPLWQSDVTAQRGLGYCDPAAWAASRDLLRRLNLLGGDVDLEKTFTNRYLPARP